MKLAHTQLTENELQKRHYAFPEKRKFPLPDRDHVLSAIRFFNYVEAKDERILANAILKRMKELGMSNVNVGPTNRFRKYYSGPELKHYGTKGMKWGVWNAETRARRANAKKIQRQFFLNPSKAAGKGNELGRQIAQDPDVRKAHERYVKSRKEETRYFNNKRLMDKYLNKAADASHKKYGFDPTDKKEHQQFRDAYKYDDYDQGTDNSFTLYLNDRFKSGKVDPKKYLSEQDAARKNYDDTVKKSIDKVLGQYGNEKAIGRKGYASRSIAEVLETSVRTNHWDAEDSAKLFGDYLPSNPPYDSNFNALSKTSYAKRGKKRVDRILSS